MGFHSSPDDNPNNCRDRDCPEVPEAVLRSIKDIAEGNTVSKEDFESILKY